MKILLSPSKTQNILINPYLENREPLFLNEHNKILSQLRKLSKQDIQNRYKTNDKLTENTYHNIRNYSVLESGHALSSFTGLVFKNLDVLSLEDDDYPYITKHLRILDAFYGILEPGTLIKPYRLDMKVKLPINLYKHWQLDDYFKDELIINLASDEFSKLIHKDMLTISFLQEVDSKYKNQATYQKMARGLFTRFMIQNKINTKDELKTFNQEGYRFNEALSNEQLYVYTRKA